MTEAGNFEGHNILNVTRHLTEAAAAADIGVEDLYDILEKSRQILFAARERRVKPARDEKVLTAWNGLMLSSFAEAAAILDRPDYLKVATANAEFLLANMRRNGLLLRTYKDGQAKLNGYLEDYAFLIEGLVTLFEVSGEPRWFEEALSLTTTMIDEFWDDQDGGFFYTGRSHEDLIVRSKDFFDNATPAGNSVAAEALLRIGLLTDSRDYQRRAVTILRLMATALQRYPSGFGRLLGALDFHLGAPKEIALIGDDDSPDTQAMRREIWKHYLPNKVVAQAGPNQTLAAQSVPLLQNRPQIDGKATAYVCENFTCQTPTASPSELSDQLLTKKASTA